jgi:hypothetical protein
MTLSALSILALQVEPPPLTSKVLQSVVMTALFLAFVIAAMVVVFRYLRAQRDGTGTAKLREEFEKTKEVLLATAMARKHEAAKLSGSDRDATAEEREKELLLENVDVDVVFGHDCPLCGLELSQDEELTIDPYRGGSYHLSCFLNAWPPGEDGRPSERPKFIYRYPQGTVVRSDDIIRSF